jgi:hypothetical protein
MAAGAGEGGIGMSDEYDWIEKLVDEAIRDKEIAEAKSQPEIDLTTPAGRKELKKARKNKAKGVGRVNAQKVFIDGYKFDSAVEFQRYRELKLLAAAGEITDLVVHPSFVLQEGFTYHGKKVQPIKFTADFEYVVFENGWRKKIVEDVKSNWTKTFTDYSIRRRMFIYQHQDIDFREVVR